MIVCCCFLFEIKPIQKGNFGHARRFFDWAAVLYFCAFLTVDLLFVAEIPRNAATIKYRFLFNQASVLQCENGSAHREPSKHIGRQKAVLQGEKRTE